MEKISRVRLAQWAEFVSDNAKALTLPTDFFQSTICPGHDKKLLRQSYDHIGWVPTLNK